MRVMGNTLKTLIVSGVIAVAPVTKGGKAEASAHMASNAFRSSEYVAGAETELRTLAQDTYDVAKKSMRLPAGSSLLRKTERAWVYELPLSDASEMMENSGQLTNIAGAKKVEASIPFNYVKSLMEEASLKFSFAPVVQRENAQKIVNRHSFLYKEGIEGVSVDTTDFFKNGVFRNRVISIVKTDGNQISKVKTYDVKGNLQSVKYQVSNAQNEISEISVSSFNSEKANILKPFSSFADPETSEDINKILTKEEDTQKRNKAFDDLSKKRMEDYKKGVNDILKWQQQQYNNIINSSRSGY